ncbi:MAG: S16 family serine protease [Candidatus Micrarchaeales archaeon]
MKFTTALLAAVLMFIPANAGFVGSAYIYAPAVLTQTNKGSLTTFFLNVTTGNGLVTISGPSSIGSSTLQSAEIGASYACNYLGLNKSDYDFFYFISDRNTSVTGPSGGLAFTLDAISALSHKPLLHNFTLTGTIDMNGTVGIVGGVYDKVSAAKEHGLKFMLVPYVQNGSFENLLYYITQQEFGIPLVEVNNVSQALQFATGEKTPYPLNYSNPTDYNVDKLPPANLTCIYCNKTAFKNLTSFTFNFTNETIASIPPIYQGAKLGFSKNMEEYAKIAQKGYLYTAANFAYLTFSQAFLLANLKNANFRTASQLISNVSNYCSSLVPPQITSTNYEYVVGGEFRQELGIITATNAASILNASDTTDGVFEGIYGVGEAYGWCLAASDMYSIASNMGGVAVESSPSLKSYAMGLINNASIYGWNMYLQAAKDLYSKGEYPASIYSGIYASIFGNPIITNYTPSQYLSIESSMINTSNYGIWPNQFASSAKFYINEYNITGNSSYLESAYSLALLASKLSSANKLINSSFVPISNQSMQQCSGCSSISSKIQEIYFALLFILVILFIILVLLLVVLLRPCPKSNPSPTPSKHKKQAP